MKRVLIISEVFYPETGLINDFATELVRQGYRVDVLTQHPSYPLGKIFDGYENKPYVLDRWNDITIHRFELVEGYCQSKIRKIWNYYRFVRSGSRIAREIGRDYDHILVYQTGPLTVALPGVAARKKFGVPLTVWTFDIWPDAVFAYGFPRIFPLTTFLNYLIRKVYRAADHIFVSSRQFSDVVGHYVPDKEIAYAPNWLVEEPGQVSPLLLPAGKIHFTFTGNVSVAQNLTNVLLGWEAAKLDNAVLNIVGDGSYLKTLRRLVESRRIPNAVFHGRYPSAQMQDILSQSDVLVLSLVADRGIAKTEPYKLQSYLKAGKPILGAITGSGKEIIDENRLGLCADPTDPTEIAEVFKRMIPFAAANRESVRLQAGELLRTRFNRNTTIQRVLSVLSEKD